MPRFVVGRVHWDNWLVWKARSTGAVRRRAIEQLLSIPEGLTIQADAHLSGLAIFLAPIVSVPE